MASNLRNQMRLKSNNKLSLIIIQAIVLLIITSQSIKSQIVSHELRRLATSTNQFGMDTLKALDRIEPPDKVLVFCPACFASSLMMIMMGSSKYPVVSTLRHALYVWPLKPNEINKGFKDILEHIGINQHSIGRVQNGKSNHQEELSMIANYRYNTSRYSTTIDDGLENDEERLHPVKQQINNNKYSTTTSIKRSLRPQSIMLQAVDANSLESNPLVWQRLSLPKLMLLRERLSAPAVSSHHNGKDWWNLESSKRIGRLAEAEINNVYSEASTVQQQRHLNKSQQIISDESLMINRTNKIENINSSQMSALSNVYIQRGLSMNYNYHLMLRQYYKTVIHPVDFIRNAEETRQHINSLVAANTEGKIKDLVKRETFDANSSQLPKIMIISTFHFRGTLEVEMKSNNNSSKQAQKIRNQSFEFNNNNDNNSTNDKRKRARRQSSNQLNLNVSTQINNNNNNKKQFIETEPTLLKYGHFSSLDCSVIEIPFNNRLVSLVIVMPDSANTTDLLLARMSAKIFNDLVASLVVKRLSLEIPVIKFDRGPINVPGLMRELQLENIFFGDKIYSTETGLNRWMKPNDVLHESSIDIGTINPNWAYTEDRLKVGAHDDRARRDADGHIKLDKPFLYFVMDSINGLILTMGRIRQT